MSLVKGRDFLLKVGDGGSPEVFTQLGALRVNRMTVNNRAIDVSSKDTTLGYTEWDTASAITDFSVSGEGFFDDADSAMGSIRDKAIRDGGADPEANFHLVDGTGKRYSGTFVIESFEQEGPTEGPVTYTVSLRNKGDITYETDA